MPALVTTNVFEAFRFINHPVLKEAGKRVRRSLRHKVKKLGKKIKKFLLNPFHLKCRDGAPPPSQCTSTGTQTVPSTLLAQLSHEGDIDMAHHGVPNPKHSFNSNNHNEKMLSQQPKLIPLTTRNNPMTATATANKAPTTGTVKAPGITDSSHKQAVLPSKLSIAEKGKAVTSFMHTQSNQSVQLRPKLSASMSDQQHMSSFNSADSGYNSHMRWRSSSDVSSRTIHHTSCTSGQSIRVSGAPKRSQSMDSCQRIRGNRSQVLRKSASMTSLRSGSRCSESMPSARISNDDHTPDGSGNKQNIKNERTISPTYNMFADMLKSVRAYCGVGYKSLKCQTSCGLENILSSGGVVGLSNLGNTCYMNSTLQCLSHTVEMTQAFLGLEKSNYKSMLSISRAYEQLMQEMWLRPSPSHQHSNAVAPRELKEKLGRRHPDFAGCIQNDSQEFLRILLSELHEDMKTKTSLLEGSIHSGKSGWASFEDSPVSRVFQGQLRSTLSCDVCKRSSMTLDPFWDLSVPVQEQPKEVQLEDSLNLFTKKEVLKGENKPIQLSNKCLPDPPTYPPKHTPSFSQALSKMSKMSAINETNDYREISTSACITKFFEYKLLIISDLMRFSGWLHPAKISTPVDIPNSLDMSRYASPEIANEQYKDRRITYELYAMSNHSGSVSCGHYTASVKHYASNHWYTFNDSRVTRNTSLEQTSKARNSSKQAYILFYRRCVTAS